MGGQNDFCFAHPVGCEPHRTAWAQKACAPCVRCDNQATRGGNKIERRKFIWHIQINVDGEQVVELEDLLRRLPNTLVFDHLAHPPLPAGIAHPSHTIVCSLIDKGHAWVKLSGAYLNSKIGPPDYPEATKIAQAFVKAAPDRVVWGSDGPHPGMPDDKPDDALLFDLLSEWAPDEAMRNRILVQNPETLYGFPKMA